MADQDMLHAAELLKAAMPFVDPKTKVMAEMFTKLFDLMGTFKSFANMNLAACGFEGTKPDMEGLLKGIRPLCSGREREWVDRFLNIFNMRRMFEMYNNMMSAMKTMQEFGGFNFNDSENGMNTDSVMGNFSGMNFESIFNSFKGTSEAGNGGADHTSETYKGFPNDGSSGTYKGFPDSSSFGTSEGLHNGSSTDSSDAYEGFNNDNASGSYGTYEDFKDYASSFFDTSEANNANSSTTDTTGNQSKQGGNSARNGMMFEMLKNMVPPEQMSTFENLSMLFNTMSYDNNSKPNDSEEHSNG